MTKVKNPLLKPGDYFFVPDSVAGTASVKVSDQTGRTRVSLGTARDDPKPPDPPTAGAFLSYPDLPRRGSDPNNHALYDNATDLVIEKRTIKGLGQYKRAIVIRNPRGTLTLRDIDFQDVGECIYIVGGQLSDLRIERCRFNRILGPSHDASGRTQNLANFLQLNDTQTKGRIGDNKGFGGNTEDIVSITGRSGGAGPSGWLDVEDNTIDGTGWTSGSGSGIAGSDGHGGYVRIRRNKLTNPGQVGWFFASGGPHEAYENVMYNRAPTKQGQGDQPFYVANYGAEPVHDVMLRDNKADWRGWDGNKRNGHFGTTGPNVPKVYAEIVTLTPAELAAMKPVL